MKDWQKVPKPERVAQLEVDERGYPIFYAIQPPPGKALDFRVLNVEHHMLTAKKKLCAICGQKLDHWLHFIGGPMCLKGRGGDRTRRDLKALDGGPFEPPALRRDIFGIFGDGPMHRECAHYALQVCPFLTLPTMQYKKTVSDKVENTVMDKNVITKKPRYIIVYMTRTFRLEPAPGGKPVFRTAPPRQIEWRDNTANTLGVSVS